MKGEKPQPLHLPFDPVARAREVEGLVMDGPRRKYYRFRAARYYGGIATADAVGCCLLCAYCWNYGRNLDPVRAKGFFVSPEEAGRVCVECLACEIECALRGRGAITIELPIPGLEEYKARWARG